MLNLIHENYDYVPVKSSIFLQLHRDLYKVSSSKGGRYKTADNVISEADSLGNNLSGFAQFLHEKRQKAWITFAKHIMKSDRIIIGIH